MEPFKGPHEIDFYKSKIGMTNVVVNYSSKIWVFWNDEWIGRIISDSHQHITVHFTHKVISKVMVITAVYARCTALERLELWENLELDSSTITDAWIVGGDFNVIVDESEKFGGLPVTQHETIDFAQCINNCTLNEVKFVGSQFTWWNSRIEEDCIFKRLDRVLGNMEFFNQFPMSKVQHLVREGSDHAPLLLNCNANMECPHKTFRFLNFWVKNEHFLQLVKDHWQKEVHGSPFQVVHEKMKSLAKLLTKWSKDNYRDFFKKIHTMEEIIKMKELQLKTNRSEQNRMDLMEAEEQLQKLYQIEEDFWKQKAGMKWFDEGDRNTNFFHSYVKEKRRKLHIAEIENDQGLMINDVDSIGEEAVRLFQQQFAEVGDSTYESTLEVIPNILGREQKDWMDREVTEEEIKQAIFSINSESASGPDGFSGKFFQVCWDIIKEDMVKLVVAFFCGWELPKYITHTTLVLIPKKERVKGFQDLRPISLSTFINKVISKIIHGRLVELLPEIISKNQSGFMKGRSIAENVLLAQEQIRDIGKRSKHHNVVVKLNMEKAYDRVSWVFLLKVMRRFGFTERIIDMIWRLISNNWYTISMNGKNFGFFHFTRGLKQGDPLSPTLFIIAAEVLSRNLNKLREDADFEGYGLPKWSEKITHLSYADDTILFCSGHKGSVKKMMDVLKRYEKVSGQLINLNKSYMYMHEKVPMVDRNRLRKLTSINIGSFLFTYLGCPMIYGRMKKIYFDDLATKIRKRVMAWHSKLLTYGGRYVLVKSILQSMPIYLLSAMNPPKGVIDELHKIMAKFFWNKSGGITGKHWLAWDQLCLPIDEGGLGFRSLHTIAEAMQAKLWWNFRTTSGSLWANYMWNKYCKKHHPVMVQSRVASQVWKKMIRIREEVEHNIWWQLKTGEVSFWFDNWTKQGALYYVEEKNMGEEEIEVREFINEEGWDRNKLEQYLSNEMVDYVTSQISPKIGTDGSDKAWWMGENCGNFSVKSAWEIRGRIPTDDNLQRMRINIASRCWCCEQYHQENMEHVFLTAPIALALWRHFANFAGLKMEMQLQQVIYSWWYMEGSVRIRRLYNSIPTAIIWALWKRRNGRKHGEDTSLQEMILQVTQIIQHVVRRSFPSLKLQGKEWGQIIKEVTQMKVTLYYHIVKWIFPIQGVIKCNTDGACRGNPGIGAYGFCLRDHNGDLIYVEAANLGYTANVKAEMKAILEAVRYCVHKLPGQVMILESDSLLLVNMIKEIWKVPWELAEIYDELKLLLDNLRYTIHHIFREGNSLADYIANLAITDSKKLIFHSFKEMHTKGRRIINSEKALIPSLRIRTKRILVTS